MLSSSGRTAGGKTAADDEAGLGFCVCQTASVLPAVQGVRRRSAKKLSSHHGPSLKSTQAHYNLFEKPEHIRYHHVYLPIAYCSAIEKFTANSGLKREYFVPRRFRVHSSVGIQVYLVRFSRIPVRAGTWHKERFSGWGQHTESRWVPTCDTALLDHGGGVIILFGSHSGSGADWLGPHLSLKRCKA